MFGKTPKPTAPKLKHMSTLADEGIVVGFEPSEEAVERYVAGMSLDRRELAYHRDPALTTQANSFYVVAVYTNKRDRPVPATYARLRFSPRNAMLQSHVKKTLQPGERVAFIWHVQKTVEPQVAHMDFSERPVALESIGQRITLHVPAEFRTGLHAASVTPALSGMRSGTGVIAADPQAAHHSEPSRIYGSAAKTTTTRIGK